ncbi:SDR family oxidoreductase [Streptomyces sp. NPDC021225]|uniref:SDR family oxidoreductase n=1 Tax=Streptomyces sp. NPDC021225 TaxID=3365121 RepID=UPI0037AABA64
MSSTAWPGDLVIGVTPFGRPDARLAAAVGRAGGFGVLDLGAGDRWAREALECLRGWAPDGRYGVRIGPGCRLAPADLLALRAGDGAGPGTVVLAVDSPWAVADCAGCRRVLVEVTDLEEALHAVGAGAQGLIARGGEGGGRVGVLGSFVLLQQLLAEPGVSVPVWAGGGIGHHTAAAAVVGGAVGVVLDTQLALLAESGVSGELAAVLRSLDGSETVVVDGCRVLRRRGRDPHARPLPVGQDGFLAARFAERYGDVGRAVRAVAGAVRDAVRDDRAAAALCPGSAMCGALGSRLPVVQGPMTRVSDRAGFASAVAAEGAVPFLALALAGSERARAMLVEAAAVLEGRSWGVGVLGFAPEEIRQAQLEAVREVRPSHAIIAGGRPAQAEALERAGIATFLHVPSPGLLGQFLRSGARRFVFEGSECGGHVGPRHSFPLWEAQIAVIEDFLDEVDQDGAGGDDEEHPRTAVPVEVFFAGGVHDERSAAMVAALAAPLTRRGVLVGLLMGTAYLFTEEAVTCGAVQPLFQRQVVAARGTALLETAPGHATRCVPSPFTEEFGAVRERLRGEGVPEREVWERLERLNVGRLRIAGKGVERGPGGELAVVGEERQYEDGMFMAGDVAVLRSATTTVAALHHCVAAAAADFFRRAAAVLRERLGVATPGAVEGEAPAPLEVAVVGMACMFPRAPDLATFWAHVVGGVDAVTEVPVERWDPAVHYSPGEGAATAHDGASASKWGGFLPPIPFDPLRYGIPPASLGSIEPVQLLALEAARRALEDAGYQAVPGEERGSVGARVFDRSRTSVVFGAEAGSDLSSAQALRATLPSYFGSVPEGLAEQLPELTEDSFPGMLANVIAGRIANRLDLGGANYTVDAACASSLAAVDVACKELVSGSSDLVLCGGADLHNGVNDYVLFSSVHALSPTGRSRTFDASADGIALGEGVACVVLKRLADAERDGDRVYGVIKGVGSSSDGRSLGLTAPRPEGQRAALERAYRNARISPADVGLLEAHGTGTVVGDRTELAVLTEVFTAAGAAAGGCALGSVKSQIGHTKCAAGLAGLVKTALALHTGVKPPTSQLRRPGASWDAKSSPFAFHTEAGPWVAPPAERIAALSAFGFGGTNFHVVLAAHDAGPPPAHALDAWPAELFTFRGTDRAAALRAVEEALALAEDNEAAGSPWRLRDLALAAATRSDTSQGPVWAAVVATAPDGPTGPAALLRRVLAGEHDPATGIYLAGPADATGLESPADPQGGDGPAGRYAADREGLTSQENPGDPEDGDGPAGPADAEGGGGPGGVDGGGGPASGADTQDGDVPSTDGGAGRGPAPGPGPVPGSVPGPGSGSGSGSGKVAFLFPGQGSQRPGMFADLFVAFPELHGHARLARSHAAVLHPPAAFDEPERDAQRARITDTRVAQPALGVVGLAAHSLLTAAGVRPDMAAGHSYGELVALCAAGVLDPPALLDLSAERASAIWDAAQASGPEPGTMAAVTAGHEDVEHVLRRAGLAGQVVAANHNAPRQTAISGPRREVDTAVGLLREAGYRVKRLPVACAFHSPLVATAGHRFATALARQPIRPPEYPVWANRTAAPHPAEPDAIRAELSAQIGAPVRFAEQIEAMYEAGARIFVEAGPGTVLTHLVSEILGDRPHHAIAFEGRRTGGHVGGAGPRGLYGFLDTLAQLAVAGLPVRTGWMFRGRDAMDAGRATPPKRPGWTVDGHLVRTATGELLPGALAPARRVKETTVTQTDRDALILEFLRTSREMVAAQRDVLLTHLGATPDARPAAPAGPIATVTGTPVTAVAPGAVEATAALPPPPAGEPTPTRMPTPRLTEPVAVTEAEVARMVAQIISERTGYPVDMIEPDLDLEADLSIDSIKRAEIAGELAGRLGVGGTGGDGAAALADEELEELTKARTTAAVTAWLTPRLTAGAAPGSPAATGAPGTARDETAEPAAATASFGEPPVDTAPRSIGRTAGTTDSVRGVAPKRMRMRAVPLAPGGAVGEPSGVLSGKRFVLLGGDEAVAEAVGGRLRTYGAEAVALAGDPLLTEGDGPSPGYRDEVPPDGVILLPPSAGSGAPVLPAAFPVLRAALAGGPRWLLAARRAEPLDVGTAGLHGLFRTVAREYPQTAATVVDLPAAASPDAVADALLDEVFAPDHPPVVLRTADGRDGLELVESDLGVLGASGAGPAGDGAAEAAALGLGRDSVIVLVGGARGITARCAAALAVATGCRIELLGRTPVPAGPEDPATAGARDEAALRAALAARGGRGPAEIQREAAGILARREVAATLRELTDLGARARYRSVDFRDPDAVRQAVKEIHADHGRLDGVVYAAGVIEDRLIEEKSAESFQRVFDTKAGGARTLLDALEKLSTAGPAGERGDGGGLGGRTGQGGHAEPSFVVLFGSVSAVLGNRGQADYAAANDALEAIGARWAARTGRRALTVHWGPWAPTGAHAGMVSPALAREYARRGVELIDPDEGALALLRELAWGEESDRAVVYTASGW